MRDDAPAVPDFTAPIDIDAELRALRPGTVTKGMFLQGVLDDARRAGLTMPEGLKYTAFRDYPVEEFAHLLRDVAPRRFPGVPLREALRRAGRGAYDTLLDSVLGKVIFGVFGVDIVSLSKHVAKVYSLTSAEAELLHVDEKSSHIRITNAILLDSYQVGAFEGVVAACKYEGLVRVRRLGPNSAELFTSYWRPGAARP